MAKQSNSKKASPDVSNVAPTHAKNGKFAPGNKLGRGNPNARKVANHRQAMLEAITEEDTKAVIKKLVECARAGESWAVKEFCDRIMGKAVQTVDATVNTNELSPEEARKKIAGYFGLNEEELESKEPNE